MSQHAIPPEGTRFQRPDGQTCEDWSPADFFELSAWLGERWAEEFPAFSLFTCKWRPEDLIPGLSDLDGRIVCDEIGPQDWIFLDQLAYRTYLEAAQTFPHWARKLEHTPGVCSTMSEVLDPALFHPEMREWDHYWGDRANFNQIKRLLQGRPWSAADEYYFLAKRFVPWCTPYNREIDVPINIPDSILPKYALHSRVMHYFVPCVKAALAVINRSAVTGKREALYRWAQLYPKEHVLQEAINMLELHYEVSWLEDQPAWYAFEDRLWQFIQRITPEVLRAVTIVDMEGDFSLETLRHKLKDMAGQPMMTLYDGVRFSRIRKGRWLFYLEAPDFFDTRHLFAWEISWLKSTFTYTLFDAYAQVKWGERGLLMDDILDRLVPDVIDSWDTQTIKRVFAAAEGQPTPEEARERLQQASRVYSKYYLILERMLADAREGAT